MRRTIEKIKERKAITLIALVVTIVVILILAGITVGMVTSDNGILKETKNAKQQAEIDNEKSIVERAKMLAMMRSKNGAITYEIFEPALKDEAGTNSTEVSDAEEVIEVLFTDSNRYYEVDKDGNVSEPQEVVKDEYAGDITKGGRCDGSEEKPYEISCIEDLVVLSNIINGSGIKLENGQIVQITKKDGLDDKSIILTRNLNFKSKYSYADSTRTDFGNINGDDTDGNSLITEMTTGTGFRTIGDEDETGYKNFQGNFNGNNYIIKNLHQVTDKTGGLFGCCLATNKNMEIKNLKLSGKIEKKTNNNNDIKYSVGGIIGKIYGDNKCNIENIENYVDIYSENGNAGGIIGINFTGNNVKINNCVNYGNIINNDSTNVMNESAGGVIGFIYAGKTIIVNCLNYGNISGKDNYAYDGTGGIVGGCWSGDVNIYNSCNYGKVEGNRRVGGIAGTMHLDAGKSFNFINVYNVGNIESSTAYGIGGILGAKQSTSTTTVIANGYYASTREKGVGSGMNGAGTKYTIQQMKEHKFIDELNGYIDFNGDNIDTSEWKKWKVGENGFPTHIK